MIARHSGGTSTGKNEGKVTGRERGHRLPCVPADGTNAATQFKGGCSPLIYHTVFDYSHRFTNFPNVQEA